MFAFEPINRGNFALFHILHYLFVCVTSEQTFIIKIIKINIKAV